MLTDYEYTFLRSYILGISDLSIQKMLSLEIEQFQKIKSNLFLKLEVQNTYSAVRKLWSVVFCLVLVTQKKILKPKR